MPRIQAASVAEHHARQRRALLDAARALLVEADPQAAEPLTMGAVGRRAGLARSSVYQYFASPADLLAAVVEDVFPIWADHVVAAVEAHSDPGAQAWAYVEANVELFTSAEQSIAHALARAVDPGILRGPMEEFHTRLQVPLRTALEAFGEPEPDVMAEHLDALVVQATRHEALSGERPDREVVLARLRRLLGLPAPLLTPSTDDDGPRRAVAGRRAGTVGQWAPTTAPSCDSTESAGAAAPRA